MGVKATPVILPNPIPMKGRPLMPGPHPRCSKLGVYFYETGTFKNDGECDKQEI